MNPGKAIKILRLNIDIPGSVAIEEVNAAEELGIEALKNYQKLKLTTFLPIGYMLPGETKD